MTTARSVISTALGVHLNRLAPGETLDPDTAARCLEALNDIVDEMNGGKDFLYREILTPSAAGITGTSAALGVDWPTLKPGDQILGATAKYGPGSIDVPLSPLSLAQYADIPLKSAGAFPQHYVHDGLATVSFYPACSGQIVTLRTKQVQGDFADIETDYEMPKGYRASLSAMLAAKLAPSLLGSVPKAVEDASNAARSRMAAQAADPAILRGSGRRGNIFTGFY